MRTQLLALSLMTTLCGCGPSSDPKANVAETRPAATAPGARPRAPSPLPTMPPAGRPTTSPVPTPSPAASQTDTATGSRMRQCELTVDGTTYVKGRCLVFPGGNGYTLNTWDRGKPAQSHFAVVNDDTATTGEAYWNADPDDTKASDSLGPMTKRDGCWVNARARICAR